MYEDFITNHNIVAEKFRLHQTWDRRFPKCIFENAVKYKYKTIAAEKFRLHQTWDRRFPKCIFQNTGK